MLNSARRHRLALGVAATGSALVLAARGADTPEEEAENGSEEVEEAEQEEKEEQESAADTEDVRCDMDDVVPAPWTPMTSWRARA